MSSETMDCWQLSLSRRERRDVCSEKHAPLGQHPAPFGLSACHSSSARWKSVGGGTHTQSERCWGAHQASPTHRPADWDANQRPIDGRTKSRHAFHFSVCFSPSLRPAAGQSAGQSAHPLADLATVSEQQQQQRDRFNVYVARLTGAQTLFCSGRRFTCCSKKGRPPPVEREKLQLRLRLEV